MNVFDNLRNSIKTFVDVQKKTKRSAISGITLVILRKQSVSLTSNQLFLTSPQFNMTSPSKLTPVSLPKTRVFPIKTNTYLQTQFPKTKYTFSQYIHIEFL